jgi:lysozyme
MTERERRRQQAIRHEGLRLRLYRCTAGKLSIGVGRNIEDRGISEATALQMLDEDLDIIERELADALPWFSMLDVVRQRALVDLGFMGVPKVLRFPKMLAAIERGAWDEAAAECLDSKWARDVGPTRATTVARMLQTGRA